MTLVRVSCTVLVCLGNGLRWSLRTKIQKISGNVLICFTTIVTFHICLWVQCDFTRLTSGIVAQMILNSSFLLFLSTFYQVLISLFSWKWLTTVGKLSGSPILFKNMGGILIPFSSLFLIRRSCRNIPLDNKQTLQILHSVHPKNVCEHGIWLFLENTI